MLPLAIIFSISTFFFDILIFSHTGITYWIFEFGNRILSISNEMEKDPFMFEVFFWEGGGREFDNT